MVTNRTQKSNFVTPLSSKDYHLKYIRLNGISVHSKDIVEIKHKILDCSRSHKNNFVNISSSPNNIST